jgi:hypothetical protein
MTINHNNLPEKVQRFTCPGLDGKACIWSPFYHDVAEKMTKGLKNIGVKSGGEYFVNHVGSKRRDFIQRQK